MAAIPRHFFNPFFLVASLSAAGLIAGLCLAAPLPATVGKSTEYTVTIRPFLKEFCFDCHNDQKHKGDLSLERFVDQKSLKAVRETWKEVLRKLRIGEMPPESRPQPAAKKRELVVAWIENELFPVDCANPDPGRVTIRRLNRAEYNNTIRDLVGIKFKPADDFPADDSGYGFDNIGDALSVSPLLMERYLEAAEAILNEAIADPATFELPRQVFPAGKLSGSLGGAPAGADLYSFTSGGNASLELRLAAEGEYRLAIRAYAQQAGPELAKMGLLVDGSQVHSWEVKGKEISGLYDHQLSLRSGRHQIGAAFLNDYYQPTNPDPGNRDRNLFVQEIQVVGPLNAPRPPAPESHRTILFCPVQPGHTNECARLILEKFTTRAYRRPVTGPELDRLESLFAKATRAGASFEGGIKIALQAVLISPHFLFRGELQPEPDNAQVCAPIDEFALASRLSYFLWSSMPDDELFALAQKKRLRKNLPAQVRRMLADVKAKALIENFGGQWLQTRNLDIIAPDPKSFPEFDTELRKAMVRETDLFFETILREDRSILDFISADYTFVDERLARHYGITQVQGAEFRKVSLKGTGRGGVLTQGSVLTLTSNPTRTSPVKRGKWVLENLLGQPPPPPPPNVPPLNDSKEAAASASIRERLERHRSDPLCASCHSQMDPIGFSLDHFDAIGAWREKDGAFIVDASGQLPSGEKLEGAIGLRALISGSRRDQFVHCLAEKMLTYALGRGLEYYDRCAIEKIQKEVAKKNCRFSALIIGVVESVPFQMRRGESGS